MAEVKGRCVVDSDKGVVLLEVPERGLAGLLSDVNFTPSRGMNGEIGTYAGVPVLLRRSKPRK